MIRTGLIIAALLAGGLAQSAEPPLKRATALCGALTGQSVALLHPVLFLDRGMGWAVKSDTGNRSVLRESCLERSAYAMARHRCGAARGTRVFVLRYAGVLANQRDPGPFSLTALYEIAFAGADGLPLDTPETELVFRGCLTLDAGERWPEPIV